VEDALAVAGWVSVEGGEGVFEGWDCCYCLAEGEGWLMNWGDGGLGGVW